MKRIEFERVTPESVGISSKAISLLIDKLESGFTEPHGIMIMRHGKVCAEGWWSPYAPGIRHGLQSHTKTYAATAVGIAYTEGLLKLSDRIIDIFKEEAPDNPSENLKRLTVHHVLCMGCGMDEMPKPSPNWVEDFLATPVRHAPGTTYMYNSTGSTLLGAIVRKLTGLGLHQYLKTRLFDKIGIDADNLRWIYMPDGMEVGGGGLYATTEDNLRLMKLYADGGVWNGERILAADFVSRAVSIQNDSASEEAVNPLAKDNFLGYGYQIWMCRPKGVYRADGAMGQFTIVVPDRDMIIAITENAAGAHWAQKTLEVIWEFIDDIGCCDVFQEDEEASAMLAARMRRLALCNPEFAPYSAYVQKVNGVEYRVTEGELVLENAVAAFMAGKNPPAGISSFKFEFYTGRCFMSYIQEGEGRRLEIAVDGSKCLNNVISGSSPVSIALANGSWKKENVFELRVRWVETCFERKFLFIFNENKVDIKNESIEIFTSGNNPQVSAVAVQ